MGLLPSEIAFPVWLIHKRSESRSRRFASKDEVGLYVEFYRPQSEYGVDIAQDYVLVDDMGREIDAVIDNQTVVRFSLLNAEPNQELVAALNLARDRHRPPP